MEKWIKKGDMNTKYFHHFVSHRRRCNYVEQITVENCEVKCNNDMRKEAGEYFYKLYIEELYRRPRLDSLHFEMLDEDTRNHIKKDFTKEEKKKHLLVVMATRSPA